MAIPRRPRGSRSDRSRRRAWRFPASCLLALSIVAAVRPEPIDATETAVPVRILGADGEPCEEAIVGIFRPHHQTWCGLSPLEPIWGPADLVWSARTDAEGVARVPIAPLRDGARGWGSRLDLRVGSVEGAGVARRLDVERLTATPRTLRLRAPLTRVRVHVVDRDGGPVEGACIAATSERNAPRFEFPAQCTDAQGTFELQGLAPGVTRIVHAYTPDGSYAPAHATVVVPEDESPLGVLLALPARGTTFTWRADVECWAFLEGMQGQGAMPLFPRRDGTTSTLRMPHWLSAESRRGGRLRIETFSLRRQSGGSAPAVAVVDLPDPWPEGDLDLGDVVLESVPVVAAGIVLDRGTGQPAAGWIVEAQWRAAEPDASGHYTTEDVTTESGTDGRFELRAAFDGGTWTIGAATKRAFDVPQTPFAAGATDLRLEAFPGASFRCRVALPKGADAKRVRAYVYERGAEMWEEMEDVAFDGALAFELDAPGDYRLDLEGDFDRLLGSWMFTVRPDGAVEGLPDVLDLSRLRVVTVAVQGSARPTIVVDGGSRPEWSDETLQILTPFDAVEVAACGMDCRVARWRLGAGSHVIRLERERLVRVTASGARPDHPWRVTAIVRPRSDDPLVAKLPVERRGVIGENGRAVVSVTGPAAHEAFLVLEDAEGWETEESGDSEPFRVSQIVALDVGQDESVSSVEIAIDDARFAEVMERLGR